MTRAEALTSACRRLTDAALTPAEARAEAALLLRYATNLSREELFLRPDIPLTAAESERFDAAVARRAGREPLAYITGARDFYGLTFAVTPAVLIPRPETEGVVEAVLDKIAPPAPNIGGAIRGKSDALDWRTSFPKRASGSPNIGGGGGDPESLRILDLCTGSGCIAVAVAVHAPDAQITATDVSPGALAVARANAERHGVAGRVTFSEGDLFDAVPGEMRFAVIASNPPYIAPEEIAHLEPEVRDFEPRIALGVHPDALSFYRRIASGSPAYLAEAGSVIVEVGQGQSDAVRDLFRDAGFASATVLPDLAGIPRVVIASRVASGQGPYISPSP